MTITLDNEVDTIKIIGGEKFFDKLNIVGTQKLPKGEDWISGIVLLYYSKRNMAELKTPPTSKGRNLVKF